MNRHVLIAAGASGLLLAQAGQAQLVPYSQDFESLDRNSLTALSDDGWNLFGTVFESDGTFAYVYENGSVLPAPNDANDPNISVITEDVGGNPPAGTQGLLILSDYKNGDHGNGSNRIIQPTVFQEQTISASDIGSVWEFSFLASPDQDLTTDPVSQAYGFFKTIDPSSGFSQTNFIQADTSALGPGVTPFSIQIDLSDPALEGQLLQFGFETRASNFGPSAVNYDNLSLAEVVDSIITGDYNGDGFVSQPDLDLVLLNWGDASLPAGFDEDALDGGGPFDSLISQNELDGVLLNWGDGTPPAPAVTAVPEPTTAALMGLAGFAMLRRRSA